MVNGNITIRYSIYDFLFQETMRLSCTIVSYLSKVADFNSPHLHFEPSTPIRGDPVRILPRFLASVVPGLSRGMFVLSVLTIPACDRHDDSIYRTSISVAW